MITLETFKVDATESTPYICFNPETNVLTLKGNSYPENSYEFYKPVREWLKQYLDQLSGTAILDLELIFLNTSSSRVLLSIFEMLEKEYSDNKQIIVNWHNNSDNEMGQVYYEYFKGHLSIPFHIIEDKNNVNVEWEEDGSIFDDDDHFLDVLKTKISKSLPFSHPLYNDIHTLINSYEKNLDETKRMIHISDLLEKNLKEANNKLEMVNELKNQLIALVIHDLKNPLTIISAYLKILRSQLNPGVKQEEMFDAMERAAYKMQNLIIDLLENDRIGLESIKIKPETLDIIDLIRNIIADNILLLENKKQNLLYKPPGDEIYSVYTDRVILTEIIENLLSNAIKYSQFNETIELITEKIKNQNGEVRIKISVKDNGPGIDKNDIDKIFKKCQTLSAKPTGNESSTGIGLYLTKKFADLLHGELTVESIPGKGSIFAFEINTAG